MTSEEAAEVRSLALEIERVCTSKSEFVVLTALALVRMEVEREISARMHHLRPWPWPGGRV